MLVLKNCGPKGYPGMAEVGNMGLPPKLLQQGVTDMVRISDARMSGTAYGTVVLHVAPEAAVGGPLALVRDGDMIELDVEARRLHLDVADDELARAPRRLASAGAGACRRAAMRSCTSSTCCRPTRAPISTSWSAAADTRCRESRIDELQLPAPSCSAAASLTDSKRWKLEVETDIWKLEPGMTADETPPLRPFWPRSPGLLDATARFAICPALSATSPARRCCPTSLERLRAHRSGDAAAGAGTPRLGPCVGQVGKFICIGLNYSDHAAESGMAVPKEPIIFMKATSRHRRAERRRR